MNEQTLIKVIAVLLSQLESTENDRDNFRKWWFAEAEKNKELTAKLVELTARETT